MNKSTKAVLSVLLMIAATTALPGCLGFGLGCGPIRAAIGMC
jgi:hypothetical protein